MQYLGELAPEQWDSMSLKELSEAAVATCRLLERSRFALGRALSRIREEGSIKLGFSSVVDYAEVKLRISRRECYLLMRLDRETQTLPRIRAAYESGELPISKVRSLVDVATADDEERWLALAKTKTSRQLSAIVKGETHARAERGEAAWPETNLYGELGRPDPPRPMPRPYTKSLLELESAVWELHNRFSGCDTSWAELQEAALVSYQQELDLAASYMESTVRETLERDLWRCRVPHCTQRSTLEVHHVTHRSQGGGDDPDALITACALHHRAHHDGLLMIEGSATSGFRFASRASVFDDWESMGDTSHEPELIDPHESAWDLAELAPAHRSPASYDDVWRRPYWNARTPRPRYGGRLLSSMARLAESAHVCTLCEASGVRPLDRWHERRQ